jgi:hypothetical protein
MRAPLISAIALALAVAGGGPLEACGSGTKTVSVGGPPPASQTTAGGAATSSTATAPGNAGRTATGGGTPGTSTRKAPEPAFAQQGAGGEGLASATAVLRARGFTPNNTADYHANQTLRVLVGRHSASGDGYGQQAFFFLSGRYIGTDASQPSATLKVLAQNDTEVTLAYPLYRKNDPLCCPSAGSARVRFQLNNGKLSTLDAIPPASRGSAASRY